jgi:hypothetical protein
MRGGGEDDEAIILRQTVPVKVLRIAESDGLDII